MQSGGQGGGRGENDNATELKKKRHGVPTIIKYIIQNNH
jgi:hypothetical protein